MPWRRGRNWWSDCWLKVNRFHAHIQFSGLAKGCGNSIALAMELPQSCAMPSVYSGTHSTMSIFHIIYTRFCRAFFCLVFFCLEDILFWGRFGRCIYPYPSGLPGAWVTMIATANMGLWFYMEKNIAKLIWKLGTRWWIWNLMGSWGCGGVVGCFK